MYYALAAVGGLIVGFIITRFIGVKGYHKDVADMLLKSMQMEEEQARELGKASMIDYVVEKKGMDYAIVHYGNIYHILRGLQKKDEKLSQVETAVGLFLHDAMRTDIENYKREHSEKQEP